MDAMDSMTSYQADALQGGMGEHGLLGCTYTTTQYYSTYDLCLGSVCTYNSQCNSGCCLSTSSYLYSYNDYCQTDSLCTSYYYYDYTYDIGSALAWLWWTISAVVFLIIVGCIICCVCMVKRRRREAELLTAMHHDAVAHSSQQAPTVVFQQPMQGQQPQMQ